MAAITFVDSWKNSWVVAVWAYDKILEDVITTVKDDPGLVQQVERDLAFGAMNFQLIERELGSRILAALKRAAEAIVKDESLPGMRWKERLDDEWIEKYQQAVRELLELIDRYEREVMKKET